MNGLPSPFFPRSLSDNPPPPSLGPRNTLCLLFFWIPRQTHGFFLGRYCFVLFFFGPNRPYGPLENFFVLFSLSAPLPSVQIAEGVFFPPPNRNFSPLAESAKVCNSSGVCVVLVDYSLLDSQRGPDDIYEGWASNRLGRFWPPPPFPFEDLFPLMVCPAFLLRGRRRIPQGAFFKASFFSLWRTCSAVLPPTKSPPLIFSPLFLFGFPVRPCLSVLTCFLPG